MIGTSDQSCWLVEACKILLLLLAIYYHICYIIIITKYFNLLACFAAWIACESDVFCGTSVLLAC